MAPSSVSWARQSPHHVAQKLSITTSPRYSDKRRFLPEKLLSTKSGASAPLSAVAADTVPAATSNAMSAAPLHSALIRSLMQRSSRTSSGAAGKPYADAALRVYEPGLSPLVPRLLWPGEHEACQQSQTASKPRRCSVADHAAVCDCWHASCQ